MDSKRRQKLKIVRLLFGQMTVGRILKMCYQEIDDLIILLDVAVILGGSSVPNFSLWLQVPVCYEEVGKCGYNEMLDITFNSCYSWRTLDCQLFQVQLFWKYYRVKFEWFITEFSHELNSVLYWVGDAKLCNLQLQNPELYKRIRDSRATGSHKPIPRFLPVQLLMEDSMGNRDRSFQHVDVTPDYWIQAVQQMVKRGCRFSLVFKYIFTGDRLRSHFTVSVMSGNCQKGNGCVCQVIVKGSSDLTCGMCVMGDISSQGCVQLVARWCDLHLYLRNGLPHQIPKYKKFKFDVATISPVFVLQHLERESRVADVFYGKMFYKLPKTKRKRHLLLKHGQKSLKIPDSQEECNVFSTFLARRCTDPSYWKDHGLDVNVKVNWDESVVVKIWGRGDNGSFFFSHVVYSSEEDLSQKFFYNLDVFFRKKEINRFPPICTLRNMCLKSYVGQFSLRGVVYRSVFVFNDFTLFLYWLIKSEYLGEEYVEGAEQLIRRIMREN